MPPSWPPPPAEISLGHSEVHVWCASLTDVHAELPRFWAILSPDERARSAKFHFPGDRDVFVGCRGILRELLGQYLQCDESTIEFSYGRYGKPAISRPRLESPLHFNASHSGALALYAMTAAGPVGVDVECLRTVPDCEQLASRFFAPDETESLMSLPADERMEGFVACWARKEAFLKATGEGISGGLASSPPPEWQLQQVWPAAGYVGAIAYRHDAARVSCWKVSTSVLRRTVMPCLI